MQAANPQPQNPIDEPPKNGNDLPSLLRMPAELQKTVVEHVSLTVPQ